MKAAALKKANDEGWFDAPHYNADTDSLIFITPHSFSHAFNNLSFDFGEDTIRSMAHIPEIIKEAVLVNVSDPKSENRREKKVYTFFGAIEGGNGIEPVQLTVKEFDFTSMKSLPQNIKSYFEKNGIMDKYNNLYDAKALEVIGIEGIKKESDASGRGYGENPHAQATSDSTISIADLLKLVKGKAEKYIPKFSQSEADKNDLKQLDLEYDADSETVSSLSRPNEPRRSNGGWQIYGEDVRYQPTAQEDLAPTQTPTAQADIAPVQTPAAPSVNAAPMQAVYDYLHEKHIEEAKKSGFIRSIIGRAKPLFF